MEAGKDVFEGVSSSNATQVLLKLFEASKENVEAIVDTLPSISCVMDLNGNIIRGNHRLGKLFQIPFEKLLGKNMSAIFKPADWAEFSSHLSEAAAGRIQPPKKMSVYSSDQQEFNFVWSLSKLQGSGTLQLIKVFGQDVTEVERNLRRVNRLNQLFDKLVQSSQQMMDAERIDSVVEMALQALMIELESDGLTSAAMTFQLANRAEPVALQLVRESGELRLGTLDQAQFSLATSFNIDWNGKNIGVIQASTTSTFSPESCRFIQLLGQSTYLTLSNLSFQLEMEQKVLQATQEIQQKNAQLQELSSGLSSLLDSLNDGYSVFDLNGICLPISSKRMREFFGGDPVGLYMGDVFGVIEKDRKLLGDWLELARGGNVPFDLLQEAPPVSWWAPEGSGKRIQLTFHAVFNADETVARLAIVAADRTAELEAKRRAEVEAERSQMVMKIVQDIPGFNSCLTAIQVFVADLDKLISDHESTKRFAHTYKSAFGFFGWQELAHLLHEFEEQFAKPDAMSVPEWQEKFRHLISNFMSQFAELMGVIQKVSRHADTTAQEDQLFDLLSSTSDLEKVRHGLTDQYLMRSAEELFAPLLTRLKHRAEQDNVELSVEWQDNGIKLYGRAYRPFLNSLEHLFNNIVDHGFSNPEGFLVDGQVQIQLERVGDRILLRITDSGAGIDIDKVLAKAKSMGLQFSPEETKNPLLLIFASGLSTKDVVSEKSGRGVGMEAVGYEIKQIGGSIHVTSKLGEGTTFEFLMPDLRPDFNATKRLKPS